MLVKQYIFIDESGDTGSITKRGSSKIFVMSAVYFTDKLATLFAVEKLKNLKRQLNLTDSYEFKYHRSKKHVKEAFFKVAMNMDCRLFSLIVEKNSTEPTLNYSDCLGYLLNHVRNYLVSDTSGLLIIIDGEGSNRYLNDIKKTLKKILSDTRMEIRYSNSKNDELIQIADMISGLIYETETEDNKNGGRRALYTKIRRFYRGLTRNAV